MKKKKPTALFFGSFNPIHIGHLIIAEYMVENTDIGELWFVVSPQNPHKKKQSLLDDFSRMDLVNLAIEDDHRFKASDIEFRLPRPSYTAHTLAYLHDKFPQREFALIMGADNLENLKSWKNYQAILDSCQIYTYPRPGYDGGELKTHPKVQITCSPLMEISASFIRNAISKKKNIRYLLPEKVYAHIQKMGYYQ